MVTTTAPADLVQPPSEARGTKRKWIYSPGRGGEVGGGGHRGWGGPGGGGKGKTPKNNDVVIYGKYRNSQRMVTTTAPEEGGRRGEGGGGPGGGGRGKTPNNQEVFIYGKYRNPQRMVTTTAPEEGGRRGGGGPGGGGGGNGQTPMNREVFVYGNYKNYYGYRLDRNVGEDPRLEIFRKEWFGGMDCLDIGCNEGLVTIGIAMKFKCRSILGVDIDSGLIEKAEWNLKKTILTDNLFSEGAKGHKCDISDIVSFQTLNFLECTHGCEQYDTVMGLSVTKWIHLNWGDDGLITFFVKIWNLLKPGGKFVMEPQPWTSYRKNKFVSQVAFKNFEDICIRPEKFREILLDKVGFRSVEVITDRLASSVAGFDRPIEVYHK